MIMIHLNKDDDDGSNYGELMAWAGLSGTIFEAIRQAKLILAGTLVNIHDKNSGLLQVPGCSPQQSVRHGPAQSQVLDFLPLVNSCCFGSLFEKLPIALSHQ